MKTRTRINVVHGHASGYDGVRRKRSPTYRSWVAMRQRCNDPKHNRHAHYHDRGITYDIRWERFENFLADMGSRPPGYSLDRVNADGPYSAANCRWATQKEQQNNRCNNRVITLQNVSMTVSEWSARLGISQSTIITRLHRGWSDSDALLKPLDMRRQKKQSAGNPIQN